jgi:hypothetical protein
MAQEPEGAERKAVPRVQTEQTAFERTQQLKYLISKRAIGGGLAVSLNGVNGLTTPAPDD